MKLTLGPPDAQPGLEVRPFRLARAEARSSRPGKPCFGPTLLVSTWIPFGVPNLATLWWWRLPSRIKKAIALVVLSANPVPPEEIRVPEGLPKHELRKEHRSFLAIYDLQYCDGQDNGEPWCEGRLILGEGFTPVGIWPFRDYWLGDIAITAVDPTDSEGLTLTFAVDFIVGEKGRKFGKALTGFSVSFAKFVIKVKLNSDAKPNISLESTSIPSLALYEDGIQIYRFDALADGFEGLENFIRADGAKVPTEPRFNRRSSA